MLRLVLISIIVVFTGSFGYVLIEKWSWADSLYMTAITLSTVGFGEVQSLSPTGRVFTIFLIFVGVGLIIYFLSSMAEYLVSLNMEHEWDKRRSRNMVRKMEDHVIVCGIGQVGSSAAATLRRADSRWCVIDRDPERVSTLMKQTGSH